MRPYAEEYLAHLHIDIDSDYRGKGLGRKLIEALKEQLKKENVKGFMLCAARTNDHAIGFYKKLGFERIGEDKQEYIFGMNL